MTKVIFILLLSFLLVLPNKAGAAKSADCYTTFYETKDMACVDAVINAEPGTGSTANLQGGTINPGLLGFFADLFGAYPQEKSHILSEEIPASAKPLIVAALYEADLQNDAQTYADANGLSQMIQGMKAHNVVPLKQLKPVYTPSDNDMLIGAYMASGNDGYIKRILENYSSADDGMVRDSLRLSMMQGKFGPTLTPPGREAAIVQAACQKYECKKDMHNLMRAMTLSSAFWAMQSLSRQDAGIKKTFNDFFESDPRLKQLLFVESNAFSNYMTTLVVYSAMKNSPNSNPNVDASLSIYEKLGSAQEAASVLMKNKN